jgi:proline iminopeptidase
MPYIEQKFGKTYYISKGNGGLPPLIALHGGPGSGHKNQKSILSLAKGRKVYLYDQIGCGKSSPIAEKMYSISTFVEELKLLKKKWGVEKFHLFGSSWGTTLALEYYLSTKDPDCLSLTFQSPLFSTKDWQRDADILIEKLPKKDQKVIAYCHEIGATDSKVYKESMLKYYSKHVCRDKDALKRLMASKNTNGKKIYEAMWGPSEFKATGSLKNYNRVPDLKQVKIPSLIICGKYDEARPETARKYVSKMPNAQLKVISNASHVILREQPADLLKMIEKHIVKNDDTVLKFLG